MRKSSCNDDDLIVSEFFASPGHAHFFRNDEDSQKKIAQRLKELLDSGMIKGKTPIINIQANPDIIELHDGNACAVAWLIYAERKRIAKTLRNFKASFDNVIVLRNRKHSNGEISHPYVPAKGKSASELPDVYVPDKQVWRKKAITKSGEAVYFNDTNYFSAEDASERLGKIANNTPFGEMKAHWLLQSRYRERELSRRFYPPGFQGDLQRFLEAAEAYLRPGLRILDAGCRSGRLFPYDFRQRGACVVGLDATRELQANPNLTSPVLGHLEELPFREGAFDLILCKHVVEHLARPQVVFRELARALGPGGHLVVLTSNRYHYVPLLARLLPYPLHMAINRARGVQQREVFPTLYRANTAGELLRLGSEAGLRPVRLWAFEAQPSYLAFHPLAFALGVAYERVVNRFRALAFLRVNLLALFVKPQQPG